MDRTHFIGASEISAIYGLHKWITPHKLWRLKTGKETVPDAPWLRAGRAFEPVIAGLFAEDNGLEVVEYGETVMHPSAPIAATPDYMLADGSSLVEIKTTRDWPEGGAHDGYILQVQAQMLVTGIPSCWLVYWNKFADDYRASLIAYDPEIGAMLTKGATDWWQKHIIEQQAQEIGALDSQDAVRLAALADKTICDDSLADVAKLYLDLGVKIKQLEGEQDAAKAAMLDKHQSSAGELPTVIIAKGYEIRIKRTDKRTTFSVKEIKE